MTAPAFTLKYFTIEPILSFQQLLNDVIVCSPFLVYTPTNNSLIYAKQALIIVGFGHEA